MATGDHISSIYEILQIENSWYIVNYHIACSSSQMAIASPRFQVLMLHDKILLQ